MDVLPAQVLGLSTVTNAGVGQCQHIVAQQIAHVAAFALAPSFDPRGKLTDHAAIFFAPEIWPPLAVTPLVDQHWHMGAVEIPPSHRFIEYSVQSGIMRV